MGSLFASTMNTRILPTGSLRWIRSDAPLHLTVEEIEMRGIYFDGEKAVYREDLPMPVCEEEQSLIRILFADVCSTDREILKGYRPDFRGVMGHEFVGEVVESPDPELVGKVVVGELNQGCGKCVYCRTGR